LQEAITTHGVFWLFGVVLFLSLFFIIFCVPETRGKSLEEIERLFIGEKHIQPEDSVPASESYHRVSSIANLKATPSQFL
jgi:hypothetical protein